jgi:hypothetical protein
MAHTTSATANVRRINRPSIAHMAVEEADKSTCVHRVGAVITYGIGNKPIYRGHNTNDRSVFRFHKKRCVKCSQHAEMSVASQLVNDLMRKGERWTKGKQVQL